MNFFRPPRVVAAIITIFSLLFTQLALASYVCQELGAAKPAMMAHNGEPMAGCANMDMPTGQASLCHSHCQAGNQSADTPQAPLVQPFVAAQLSVVLRVVEAAVPLLAMEAGGMPLIRSTAPPLAIQHCCFRL
jgi:hypothetical protein